jgi:hypothetical protein
VTIAILVIVWIPVLTWSIPVLDVPSRGLINHVNVEISISGIGRQSNFNSCIWDNLGVVVLGLELILLSLIN